MVYSTWYSTYAQHTVHITVHMAHSSQHALHNTQYTAHIAQCIVHGAQYTVHSAQQTAHSKQRTAHSAQCAVHSAQCRAHTVRVVRAHAPKDFTNKLLSILESHSEKPVVGRRGAQIRRIAKAPKVRKPRCLPYPVVSSFSTC